ncbi:type II toxin-antitoxin system HipA family toxin YjjJ [Pelotalea chapellei]|uniref:Type II toxin-antitoxin system HipA family toxin YjjJ n=1 Tax=Pelotalea chapellei TaxID=44671 RepID=A0ABS5UAM5_9BACT|nr:type II toxin-antitoxin system HipA family toxin YjjJ [Pelotalea chapellei]MBT1072737.1 type II toxin-antitoxin system HipA family toxin YjjJ [Pelotalea chapellei]
MRVSDPDNPDRLLSFLGTGIYSAPEIQQRFRCSQPTVSRLLAQLGDKITIIGNSRARRYTKTRDVRGLGGAFPIFKIDTEGNAHLIGTLYAVAHDHFLWNPLNAREQLFRSLPWFIADLHPEGFVGCAFVRQLHEQLGLPPRSVDWNEDHVLCALARRGEDPMGSLVIGRESIERYFRLVRELPAPIRENEIADTYMRFAQEAMDGQPVGSSAGGEQPKFTATIERSGEVRNVLVKFSPPVSTDEGRRWADLLICEHHALQVVQNSGINAVRSNIIEAGGRVFLEVIRFDRTGLLGRLPIISMRAIDNEFYGFQDNWVNAANRMANDGRLSAQDAASLRWLSVFGSLIGNNDQHFGNVSLVMLDGSSLFRLAPAYDVLPMVYRPIDGAVPSRPFTVPAVAPGAPNEWSSALESAGQFWSQAESDIRISKKFRKICSENFKIVKRLHAGPRLFA